MNIPVCCQISQITFSNERKHRIFVSLKSLLMKNPTGLFANIKGDLFGGITAGIVALPLALAFGEQTELGAVAGLYGAIALGIVAALLGGTKTQISGPTAPMTVVAAVMISESIATTGSLNAAFPLIVATFVLAGLIQAGLGFLKLGKYIKYIPYPVVSGFMSGIGIIIIITQIFPFIGAESPSGGALGTIKGLHQIPEIVNIYSVGIALATILIIYLFPKITKKIPAALAALLVISITAYFLIPDSLILKINSNGSIPSGLPALHFDFVKAFTEWKIFIRLFEYAFTLAALGAIDSLLTSVVADNITKTKHDSNRELIGQGVGNMVAGVIGGLPGAGATMRTVININSGGRTRLSGVIAGILLAAILLGLGQLVGHIPNAVLAGILVTVGIGIIDYKGMKHLKSIPRSEAVIMFIVLGLTVFVDLLVAVAAGMVLASFVFMIKAGEIVEGESKVHSLKDFREEDIWDDEKGLVEHLGDKVYIKHINGPLFFGMVAGFRTMIKTIPDNIRAVIIRMDKVPYVDQSGLYAMEDTILDLTQKEIKVLLWGIHGQPKDMFEKIDIIPDLIDHNECFNDAGEIEKYLGDKLT
jgi:SulP family sulfate permease